MNLKSLQDEGRALREAREKLMGNAEAVAVLTAMIEERNEMTRKLLRHTK